MRKDARQTNEQYLQMLESQNQQKRQAEANSKEYQERRRLEEREKGFSVHFQGANKEAPR